MFFVGSHTENEKTKRWLWYITNFNVASISSAIIFIPSFCCSLLVLSQTHSFWLSSLWFFFLNSSCCFFYCCWCNIDGLSCMFTLTHCIWFYQINRDDIYSFRVCQCIFDSIESNRSWLCYSEQVIQFKTVTMSMNQNYFLGVIRRLDR